MVSTPNTTPYPSQTYFLGYVAFHQLSNPQKMLQPAHLPGECFRFKGTSGRIIIQLAKHIVVTAVSLEYTNSKLGLDKSCAPKDFEVLVPKQINQTAISTMKTCFRDWTPRIATKEEIWEFLRMIFEESGFKRSRYPMQLVVNHMDLWNSMF